MLIRHIALLVGTIVFGIGSATLRAGDQESAQSPGKGALVSVLRGHEDGILAVDLSPDAKSVVTGSADRTARVWDALTGKQKLRLEGHEGPVVCVAWSADGRRIATGSMDRTARVWDARTGELIARLKGHSYHVHHLSISPDGSRVVTGSCDGTAIIWDVATEKPLSRIRLGSMSHQVAISPDGKRVAIGVGSDSDDDGQRRVRGGVQTAVRIFDLATGTELKVLPHDHITWLIKWSQDGSELVSVTNASAEGFDQLFRVFDAKSYEHVRAFVLKRGDIARFAVSGDFHSLLELVGRRLVYRQLSDRKVIGQCPVAANSRVVTLSSDGRIGVCAGGGDGEIFRQVTIGWKPTADNTARVYDFGIPGHQLLELNAPPDPMSQGAGIFAYAFDASSRGDLLLAGYGDGSMRLYRTSDGAFVRQFAPANKKDRFGVGVVAISPDATRVCMASGKFLRIYDRQTGAEQSHPTANLKSAFSGIGFSPDGRCIFAACGQGHQRGAWMFETETGRLIRAFPGETDGPAHLAVSPDGKQLATFAQIDPGAAGGASTVRITLWNVDSGKSRATHEAKGGAFGGGAFLEGGVIAVAAGPVVTLWNTTSNAQQVVEAHAAPIMSLAATPDHKSCVTAGKDGLSLFIEASTGVIRQRLACSVGFGHEKVVFLGDQMPACAYFDEDTRAIELAPVEP